jgi:hypothetical protein
MYLAYGNRKHWEIHLGRFGISRWCPGSPCHLVTRHGGHHWIRLVIYRRAHAARLD